MDLPQLIKVDGIGYLASLLVLLTFCMNTMMTLRAVAICSNLAFVIYGVAANVYPVLLLHLILLPLNALHLIKMVWLLRRATLAAATDLSPHWLQPFMRTKRIKAGEMLFAKGEYADALYMIASGEVELPEIELKLKPGDLFGEIGLFSVERRRTQSALARSDLELLWISGAELKKLCGRNPGLSLYFLRLMASRLTAYASRFERRSLVKADSEQVEDLEDLRNWAYAAANSGNYSTTEHWDEQRPSGAVASLQKAGALDARANPVDRLRSEVQPQRKR